MPKQNVIFYLEIEKKTEDNSRNTNQKKMLHVCSPQLANARTSKNEIERKEQSGAHTH